MLVFLQFFRSFCVFILSFLMTSCMVGPNFHTPKAPKLNSYTEKPLPPHTAATPALNQSGASQHFRLGQEIPAEWWQLFESNQLNQLIKQGLENSPNLAAACAALKQANETLNAQIGTAYLPSVALQGSGQRQRFATSSYDGLIPSSTFNLFNANVAVGYTFDIFGGARRQSEALLAQIHYQEYQLLAARLSLTSNIVITVVSMASLKEQIAATEALIKAQEDQLEVINAQFKYGAVARDTQLSQETLVAQTRATLPPLEKSLAMNYHALNVLLGNYPNYQLPDISLSSLKLPTDLPISLPSKLVRQRPDILASEALLHAASAQIGVATANLYPQISLTNTFYGWQAGAPSGLFTPASKVWSIAAQLTQPVFQGGALLANRRGAIDFYQQSLAQYQQVVLQAFQNVSDVLRALELDAKTLRLQEKAESTARDSLHISKEQYRLGAVSYLLLLDAERQYQQTRIGLIQAKAARYSDTAALFQAVGGGWWNQDNRKQEKSL